MPGITGIVGDSRAGEFIGKMTGRMKHEDFYYFDTYVDDDIALGITSIIPENKIVFNRAKTLVALMDGEIFGMDKEETDAELLLRLYEKEGTNFLCKIKGWFTLVIYDCRGEPGSPPHIFLISGRYGFKPLYYAELGNKFIFASEIKAILAHPDFEAELNPVGVVEFALFNYPLGDKTFVKNIHRFPPASIWCFRVGAGFKPASTKRNYLEVETLVSGERISADEGLKESGRVFKGVINDLIKDEKGVGLTLTAGYDTRAILSALHNIKVKCLTFARRGETQSLVASKLAQIPGYEHHIQEFEEDFVEQIGDFLYRTVWITDGLCNIVHCGLLYVFNKQCRDRFKICPYFFGYGGSEIIRGLQNISLAFSSNSREILMSNNPRKSLLNLISEAKVSHYFSSKFFKNRELEDLIFRDIASWVRYPASRTGIQQRVLFFTLSEIFRKYYWANVALVGSQVRVRLPYMDHDFISFILRTPFSILHTHQFSSNPFERLKGQRLSASIIKHNNPELLMVPTDRGYKPYWNLHWFGYPIIFWYQICRRVSPLNQVRGIGIHSYEPFLREKAKLILEEIVGASCPLAPTQRDYYNVSKIKEAIKAYPDWSLQEWKELSKVVTFELWVRQFIDRK